MSRLFGICKSRTLFRVSTLHNERCMGWEFMRIKALKTVEKQIPHGESGCGLLKIGFPAGKMFMKGFFPHSAQLKTKIVR